MNQRSLLAFLLAIGMGILGLLVFSGEPTVPASPETRPGVRSPAPNPPDEPTSVSSPTLAIEGRSLASSGTQPAPVDEPEATPDESGEPTGITLTGSLLWADNREPVPYLRIVAHFPGRGRTAFVTDAQGEFVSSPVVQPGTLRILQLGVAPRPDGGIPYPRGLKFGQDSYAVPAGVREHEIEVLLRRPDKVLRAEVRHRNGAPAEKASVSLEILSEGSSSEADHVLRVQQSDSSGQVQFAVYDLDDALGMGLLAHWKGEESGVWVSEVRSLELPLHRAAETPELLYLDEAASLLVRTLDAAGAPLAGQRIWLDVASGPFNAWLPEPGVTDQAGEVLVRGFPSGRFVVGVVGGPGGTRRTVETHTGVDTEVEFHIGSAAERLAVSGSVVDEEGMPLPGVPVTVHYGERPGSGDTRATRKTDETGSFHFTAAPCDGLTVVLDGGTQGDEYEPLAQETDFGTSGLLFRRTHRYARSTFSFEIVDAATGQRVDNGLVISFQDRRRFNYDFHAADGGLATVDISDHPGFRLMIDVNGYRRETFSPNELQRADPTRDLHRIPIEQGLLTTIRVYGDYADERADTSVSGAAVWHGSQLLGKTDSAGRMGVDLTTWPETGLRVTAQGFDPLTWDPAEGQGEPGDAFIWMERSE